MRLIKPFLLSSFLIFITSLGFSQSDSLKENTRPKLVAVKTISCFGGQIMDTTSYPLLKPDCGGAQPNHPTNNCDTKIYFHEELTSYASFPGGFLAEKQYLANNLINVYPPEKYGLSGKAYTAKVIVTIEKDGSLNDVALLKRCQVELDQATQKKILEVIKSMPNWIPGKVLDKPKASRYIIPIKLK